MAKQQGEFMTVMNFIFFIIVLIFLTGLFGEHVFWVIPLAIGVTLALKYYSRGVTPPRREE